VYSAASLESLPLLSALQPVRSSRYCTLLQNPSLLHKLKNAGKHAWHASANLRYGFLTRTLLGKVVGYSLDSVWNQVHGLLSPRNFHMTYSLLRDALRLAVQEPRAKRFESSELPPRKTNGTRTARLLWKILHSILEIGQTLQEAHANTLAPNEVSRLQ
jgi:hypothetical protein